MKVVENINKSAAHKKINKISYDKERNRGSLKNFTNTYK